ncbi:SGNH/GDSL hydrolase family protein [Acetobacteraceae bacterium KSS8]|uniref:SGNH/GDSL hydrolase family protein n=1 Tax=Endosaccharibacter trunci TaxID=2812733 RepID=A0ABT1WAE0_9PROT|nr:SGNH/GDSL hydrolase family protein [Acetobacteraceae bacterium KSS8]
MRALLLAFGALLPAAAIAAPGPAPMPPALAPSAVLSLQPVWKSVVGVTHTPDNVTTQQITGDESWLSFVIAKQQGQGQCIRLGYSGYRGNWGGMESNGPVPFQVAAAVWVDENEGLGTKFAQGNGYLYSVPVTFGGQTLGSVPVNGTVRSDPVCYPWKAGQRIAVKTQRWTVGGVYANLPTNYYADASASEASKDGFFQGVSLDPSYSVAATTSVDQTLSTTYTGGTPYKPSATTLTVADYSGSLTDNNGTFASTTLTSNSGGASLTVSGSITLSTGEIKLTLSSAIAPSAIYAAGQGLYGVTLPNETTLNNPTGFASWQTHPVYGPSVIEGTAQPGAKAFVIATAGDSINYGVGSTYYRYSWMDIANGGRFGMIGFAQPGAHLSDCAQLSKTWRAASVLGGGVDRIESDMGINDVSGTGMTLATMQSNFRACAAYLSSFLPHGFRDLYWDTMTPYTTAANVPVSAAGFGPGTVASGNPSLRNAWNAWLYTQVGVTIGGVIDKASCVEGHPASQSGAGDGTWANLNLTADDLHPSQLGHQTIGTCAAVLNSPMWTPPS